MKNSKYFLSLIMIFSAATILGQQATNDCAEEMLCDDYESSRGQIACRAGWQQGYAVPGTHVAYQEFDKSFQLYRTILFEGVLSDQFQELYEFYVENPNQLNSMKQIFDQAFNVGFSCRTKKQESRSANLQRGYEFGAAIPGDKSDYDEVEAHLSNIAQVYFEGVLFETDKEAYAYYRKTPGDCGEEKAIFVRDFLGGFQKRRSKK